jgi:hypothetical protein
MRTRDRQQKKEEYTHIVWSDFDLIKAKLSKQLMISSSTHVEGAKEQYDFALILASYRVTTMGLSGVINGCQYSNEDNEGGGETHKGVMSKGVKEEEHIVECKGDKLVERKGCWSEEDEAEAEADEEEEEEEDEEEEEEETVV